MKNERLLPFLVLTVMGLLLGSCTGEESSEEMLASGDDVVDAEIEEYVPDVDLGSYFTDESLNGTENIKLQINADVVKTLDDGAVWQIPFFFRSSVWHGNPWDHPSVLYVPSNLNPARAGYIAVIQQGTDDLDPGIDQDAQFGRETAIAMGIPVAVLAKVPHPTLFSSVESESLSSAHPSCFETFLVESDLEDCARQLTWTEEKDSFGWALESPMVKAYSRAIAAVSLVPETLANLDPPLEGVPAFDVNQVILGGAGKRARAIWMLASLDERVQGVWVAAEDRGNLKAFYENMADSWAGGYSGIGPLEALEFLKTEYGTTWEYWVDPYRHASKLEGKNISIARGTNDPFSPIGSYARYKDALPSHQLLLVPNSGYGMGTDDHVTSWRALIAGTTSGAGAHGLSAQVSRTGAEVEVVIQAPDYAAGPTTKVTVWYVQGQASADDWDLRDGVWESVTTQYDGELADGKQRHSAVIPLPGLDNWGLFARVSFTDGAGVKQVVSSAPWLSWEN